MSVLFVTGSAQGVAPGDEDKTCLRPILRPDINQKNLINNYYAESVVTGIMAGTMDCSR